MKADDLRASILQAAIQGKLTKQDPNDEPASVLVERIREEKHRLVREGKIKRDKNESFIFKRDGNWFETINGKDERCIDDKIPFDIPENWTWSRLNSVCNQIVDCPHSTPHYTESETGFYAIDTNCFDRNGKITHFRNLSKIDYESRISRLSPTGGDVVYSREGVVGYAAILPYNRKICLGQRVMLFRPSQSIHSEWIRTIVSHSFFIDVLLSSSKGIGVKHVNVGDIKLLLIPMPPANEQSSIISILDRINSLIDNYSYYEQKATILDSIVSERLTSSILQYAVQGKLTKQDPDDEPASVLIERIRDEKHRLVKEGKIKRDKNESFIFRRDGSWFETINSKDERCIDDEIPFDIPKNWTFVRLSTITLYDVGGATPSISESKYWNGNIKWASVRDIQSVYLNDTERRITETGFESCSTNIVPKGELIICTRVGLGKICIAGDDIAINQDLRGFIISNRIDRQYLIYYYRNIKLEGSGTTVKGITRNQILNLLIPLPPCDEQHQIVSKLNRLNSVLSSI